MKKIPAKALIDFRRKSPKSRMTFLKQFTSTIVAPKSEKGGHYWRTALTAAQHGFEENSTSYPDEKIRELQGKIQNSRVEKSKNMYQANIKLLNKYKGLDHARLRPRVSITIENKNKAKSTITIRGVDILVQPAHVFSFGKPGTEEIGAIWFVAIKEGFKLNELALFCDLLYRYLKFNYSKTFTLSMKYCVVVDLWSGSRLHYDAVASGSTSSPLASTLDDIIKLL